MNELTNKWKEAKEATGHLSQTTEQLIAKAKTKGKGILYFHYANILVLVIAMIAVTLFFYFVSFSTLISKIGIGFMLTGLLCRIIIEVSSMFKYKAIQFVKDASQTAHDALAFYKYRQKIHGPLTVTTVAIYVMGFYLLSPEFSERLPLKGMVLMNVFFISGAFILIWRTRKGIQKESKNLSYLIELKNHILKAK